MIPWWCWTAIGAVAIAFKKGFDGARRSEEAKQHILSRQAEERRQSAVVRLKVLLEEHLENFRQIIEAERVKVHKVIDAVFADMERVAQFKEENQDVLLPHQKRQITMSVKRIEVALALQETRLEKLEQANSLIHALETELAKSGPSDRVVRMVKGWCSVDRRIIRADA